MPSATTVSRRTALIIGLASFCLVQSAAAALPSVGWTNAPWTSDADSGITNAYPYHVAVNFGSTAAYVNAILFQASATSGTNFGIGGTVTILNGDANNVNSSLGHDFIYNASPRTITISNLVTGLRYKTTFFSVGWEAYGRSQTFACASQTLVLDQDVYGNNNGIQISHVYEADATGTVTYTVTKINVGTFHLYALATAILGSPQGLDMLSFGPGAVISGTNIAWNVPFGTDVTNLAPTYVLFPGATCDKASGSTHDFTTPVIYTVVSADTLFTNDYTVTVTVGPKVVWPITNGVTVWLTGDGINPGDTNQVRIAGTNAYVKRWPDQSGNGQSAIQLTDTNQPEHVADNLNGYPILKWDGTGKFMSGPSNTTFKTIFFVCKVDTNLSGLDGMFCASPDQDSQTIQGDLSKWWAGYGGSYFEYNNTNATRINGAATYYHGRQWHILRMVSATSPSFTYQFGQRAYSRYFSGRIAEIIAYNRALDAAEASAVETYLSNKYWVARARIDITNAAGFAETADTAWHLAGTNNLNTAGMWWTNSLGGGGALNPAPGNWSVTADLYPGTNVITVYGTNDVGFACSEAVTVRMVPEWPVISGMSVWLMSDGIDNGDTNQVRVTGTNLYVRTWPDKSGNGQSASQLTDTNQPEYVAGNLNGYPTLSWDGTGKSMSGPANTTLKTIFFVCKVDTNITDYDGIFCQSPSTDNQNIRHSKFNTPLDSWKSQYNANVGDFCLNGSVSVNGANTNRHNYAWHILREVSGSSPSFTYQLGQRFMNRYFDGRIAEYIVYNRNLVEEEARAVEEYLSNKYFNTPLYVNITNVTALTIVTNGTQHFLAGTNSPLVVAMWWTNSLGAGGTLNPAPGNWSFTAPLGLGNNVIVVRGTNAAGVRACDVVTVIRTMAPFVDITNGPAMTVPMGVTTATIGGTNNAGGVGGMRLTSVAAGVTNYTASIPMATSWIAIVSNLVAGMTNVVTMTATNIVTESSSDTILICRRPVAVIEITNIVTVLYTTNAVQAIAGTNNAFIVGGMVWTNSLGGNGVLDPVPRNWSFPITVYPGDNRVTVYGTNSAGDLATDAVTVAPMSPSNDILSCNFGQWGAATIVGTNISIDILPVASLTNIAPTFVISQYATINPPSGTTRNFTTPQFYTVTAQNGSNKQYKVTVNTWQHKRSLYVLTTPESANLPGAALETNFPLLVRLNADNFTFGEAQADGRDIRFCSPAGVMYPYQIEEWSNTTASIWVKMPSVTGNTHQEFVMCWGHTNVTSLSSGTNVFNAANGFAAALHLDGALKDEVGTLAPANVGSTVGTGIIGRGRTMASGQGVNCGTSITNFPVGNSTHTTMFWYKSPRANSTILGWGRDVSQSKMQVYLLSPPHIRFDAYFGGAGMEGSTVAPTSQWIHVANTYTAGEGRLYVNSVLDTSNIGGSMNMSNNVKMWLGGWSAYDYAGDLDEVKISRVNRSANWVKLEYENQKELQTLVGGIVQTGTPFTTVPASITMNENTMTNLVSQAGGARKVYWIYRKNGQDTILSIDRFSLAFSPGRVSGNQSCSIQFRGVYATEVKTNDVPVTIIDTIPDPAFTLLPSTNAWDGRSVMTVTTNISNWAALLASGYTNLNYAWSVDGVAVIKQETPGTLVLTRAQGSGPMTVTLVLDNGGAKITNSVVIPVLEPASDAWIVRTPDANEKPVHNQFYARDDSGYGALYYNGTQAGSSPTAFLKVYTNSVLYTNIVQTLVGGAYAFTAKLLAGLIDHRVEYGTGAVVLATVTNIICGDAYLIDGQSNAQTAPDDGVEPNPYTNFWIRCYGLTLGWGYGTRDGDRAEHKIGHWEMDIASNIVVTYRIPVCMINGAIGGTRIDEHMPGASRSIFENITNRVRGARLTHGIRAVFWHQGENNSAGDGPDLDWDYKFYQQYFVDMTAAWKGVMPNLTYYYIFQVWPRPCAMGPKGDQLREVQRNLPRLFSPRMKIMSTIGNQPAIGCHTPRAGYLFLAKLTSPLVEQDNYGYTPGTDFTAPNLNKVYFTTTNKTAIAMVFGQPMQWDVSATNLLYLDYQPRKVASGTVASNVITLQLTGPSTNATITYVNDAVWALGLTNDLLYASNGIAALTFTDVPILPSDYANPYVDITNANFTVAAGISNTMISGTNNAYVVGSMRLVSMTGTTTNYTALITAVPIWSATVSNLVVGMTNVVTVTGTNSAGASASDTVRIYRLSGDPTSVQAFEAGHGAGYGQVSLSWSNGSITVLACTNRTYTTNMTYWFELATGVNTPWTHTAASNFPSVYYRIVSGTYTSHYAVGKFDVQVAAGSIAWISFPFSVQSGCDIVSEWFGRQLEARPYTGFDFPSLQTQTTPGGTIDNSDYYAAAGMTNWNPDNTVAANAGYVLFLPQDHGAVKVTGLGMVQTNNLTMQIPYQSTPWLGLAYDTTIDMRASGLTNMLQPPRLYSSFNYDHVDSQQTPGGPVWYAEYYIDNWGGGGVNFFPSATGADVLEPGKGYLLFFSTGRAGTGTGTWQCARPY